MIAFGKESPRPRPPVQVDNDNNNYDLEDFLFNTNNHHSHGAYARFAPAAGTHFGDELLPPLGGGGLASQHMRHIPIPALPPYPVKTPHTPWSTDYGGYNLGGEHGLLGLSY